MPPSPEPPSAPSLPGGTGGGVSNGNSSPCGDPTNSSVSCAKLQLAAKTDWQTTVQLPTHIGVSNGSMLCHPTGNGFAISAGIGWGATLTATSAGNGCYSSGNDDATGTTTVTVRGSGLTPMTACFSFFVNCSDEGAKNASGSGQARESGNWLAADTAEEGNVGNVGGDGGNGGGIARREAPANLPEKGPLKELWDKGYNVSDHFVQRWLEGRGKGLTSQNIIDLLEGSGHYKEIGGPYWGVLGKIGRSTYKIVYDLADANTLVTIEDQAHGARWDPSRMMPAWTVSGWTNPFVVF